MNIMYFPFTVISGAALRTLYETIGPMTMLTPVKTPETEENAGNMKRLFTQKGDDDRITAIVRDCYAWAEVHGRGELSFLKAMNRSKTPMYDDTYATSLRSQIKKAATGGRQAETGEEREAYLTYARVFLKLAEDFDKGQIEVAEALSRCDISESGMLADLIGPGAEASLADDVDPIEDRSIYDSYKKTKLISASVREDFGQFGTKERIGAWSRLFLETEDAKGNIFVTTSRSVMDYITERCSMGEVTFTYDKREAAPGGNGVNKPVCEILDETAGSGGFSEAGAEALKNTLYGSGVDFAECLVAKGVSPFEFFSRLSGASFEKPAESPGNTVIVFIG